MFVVVVDLCLISCPQLTLQFPDSVPKPIAQFCVIKSRKQHNMLIALHCAMKIMKCPSQSYVTESGHVLIVSMSIPIDFTFLSQRSAASTEQQPAAAPLDFSFLSQVVQTAGRNDSNATATAHGRAESSETAQDPSARRDNSAICPLSLAVRTDSPADPTSSSALANGSSSFVQAFSSIKETKFYEPPPEPPARAEATETAQSKHKHRNPRAVLVR